MIDRQSQVDTKRPEQGYVQIVGIATYAKLESSGKPEDQLFEWKTGNCVY